MPTILTFRVASMPDEAGGKTVLDVTSTVTIDDATAKVMLAAQIERFTVRTPTGFVAGRSRAQVDAVVPKPDEAVTAAVHAFIRELVGSADALVRDHVTKAALAQVTPTDVKPDQIDTKVDVAMDLPPQAEPAAKELLAKRAGASP